MRRKIICFVLSTMLILTFIPQISFAVEGEDAAVDEAVQAEEQAADPVEAPDAEPAETVEEQTE